MSQSIFTHARIVMPDEVVEGTLVVRDGRIVEILDGHVTSAPAEDLEGDFLIRRRGRPRGPPTATGSPC